MMMYHSKALYSPQMEKRKMFIRSTGSFSCNQGGSLLDEQIVAPTPRKLASVPSSPAIARREKRKNSEESLFGEAGQELQTILFQNIFDVTEAARGLDSCSAVPECPDHVAPFEDDSFAKLPRLRETVSVGAIPPVERSSNPITLNSSFNNCALTNINNSVNGILEGNQQGGMLRVFASNVRQRTAKKELSLFSIPTNSEQPSPLVVPSRPPLALQTEAYEATSPVQHNNNDSNTVPATTNNNTSMSTTWNRIRSASWPTVKLTSPSTA